MELKVPVEEGMEIDVQMEVDIAQIINFFSPESMMYRL